MEDGEKLIIITYNTRQNDKIKTKRLRTKSTDINTLKKKLNERNRSIASLTDQFTSLLEENISIDTFSDFKYLPAFYQVVQCLHSFGVGENNIVQTIHLVLNHLLRR